MECEFCFDNRATVTNGAVFLCRPCAAGLDEVSNIKFNWAALGMAIPLDDETSQLSLFERNNNGDFT